MEIKALPRDDGVARETDLVTMVAQAAPTVIKHRACVAGALKVGEEAVVDPPGDAQISELLVVEPMLPVEPPEVDAVAFHGLQDDVE